MVDEASPTLRTVSIMPGMDWRAPDRTESKSGLVSSPKFESIMASTFDRDSWVWASNSSGKLRSFL